MSAPAAPAGRGFPAPGGRLFSRVFRSALLLVPLGVIANLWWTWYATDHTLLEHLGRLPRHYLLLALGLGLLPWFTNATRMWLWGRFLGETLPWREHLAVTLGSELASSVVPTSSGTEVLRWGIFVQKGVPQGRAISIVTLCWLQDSVFFALAVPLAVVLSHAWDLPVLRSVGREARGKVLVLVLVALLLVLVSWALWGALLRGSAGGRARRGGLRATARLRRRLARARRDVAGVRRLVLAEGKGLFLFTQLVTALQWACRYSVVTALAWFLAPEANIDPVLFFLLQWVVFTAMSVVPTPGGSGGAEAVFVLVYSALLPAAVIGIATSGWRLLTFYVQLALGSVLFTGLNLARTRAGPGRAAADTLPD
jgi:uncharacterized protein (TIRG00374 family)